MVYTVCTCVRFFPNLGKTDGKVCSSRSLESVVAHLEHLALCPRLFLSGRRLQPFLLLVNRWAPAPQFPSPYFKHPPSPVHQEQKGRRRPPKRKRQGCRARRTTMRLFGVADISKYPVSGKIRQTYQPGSVFPLPLIKKNEPGDEVLVHYS